ncbi:MAG: hypothetical protein HQK52_14685 [Oligoflexia bacterium]|nr:hypothetical protein [Oligoflexia bacterium]
MKKPLSGILLFFSLLCLYSFTLPQFGLDHAPLDTRHVQHVQEFVDKYFKENGDFEPTKVKAFIVRLEREKKELSDDLYETALLEGIEYRIEDYDKVKERALKKIKEQKNNFLKAYNQFLIPKIRALLDNVEKQGSNEINEGLISDFFRVYTAFYNPHYRRTPYNADMDPSMLGTFVHGFYFSRANIHHKIEANNLIVEDGNWGSISTCLGPRTPGHYLHNEEIEKLATVCHFDISTLNPGVSSFWSENDAHTRSEILRSLEQQDSWFPKEEEKLIYKNIKITGLGSQKFEAEFERDGVEYEVKVKMGHEVHSEIATGILGRLAGFTHDPTKWYPKLKIYFGKKNTFEKFKANYIQKYGIGAMRYIAAHGGEEGNEWIEIRDVQLELSHPKELRLEGYDPDAWDLKNRREHRAHILWLGWLNVNDVKPDNHKLILYQTEDNKLRPLMRMQDVGTSLGIPYLLGSRELWKLDLKQSGVNSYSLQMMDWNNDGISLLWSDFKNQKGRFTTTTYADLKWMARKISRITPSEIEYAIRKAGIPEEIVDLYKYKIFNRRNQIVQAFDLQRTGEFVLYDVPDFSSYSPNEYVQNGKVIETHLPNHTDQEITRHVSLLALLNFVNISIPLKTFTKRFETKINNAGVINPDVAVSAGPISLSQVVPGVGLFLSRTVQPNKDWVPTRDGSRSYVIQDTIGIELGVAAEFMDKIRGVLPISASGHLRVWRKDVQFTHYADSLKGAWLAPWGLFNIMGDYQNYAAFHLKAGEIIRMMDAYGFSIGAKVKASHHFVPILAHEVGIDIGWECSTPLYFYRDLYGQLNVFKEKSIFFNFDLTLNFLEFDAKVATLPLIGVGLTYNRFFHEAKLYSFDIPSFDVEATALTSTQRNREYLALIDFLNQGGLDEDSSIMHLHMGMTADGSVRNSKLSFLLFFKRKIEKGHSEAKITLDGKTRSFYRYHSSKNRILGSAMNFYPFGAFLKAHERSSSIVIEMDAERPEEFVVLVRGSDYYRKKHKNDLLRVVAWENRKYSLDSEETPFYRNFTLPPTEEVALYRKIQSEHYIYISGRELLAALERFKKSEITNLAYQHYVVGIKPIGGGLSPVVNGGKELRRSIKAKDVGEHFATLQRKSKKLSSAPKSFMNSLMAFMEEVDVGKYGVTLIKDLVGEKGLYVSGQIFGVNRRFTTLETLEAERTRRFTPKSWGTYTEPPMRSYLYNNQVLPLSTYVDNDINLSLILGEIPIGDDVVVQ